LALSEIPRGQRVFLDAPIFLHHFLGTSHECRALLDRCERSEVRGVTSAVALAELAEPLMRLEAVALGVAAPGDVARLLRERPEVVQKLKVHDEVVGRIPLMGVEVLSLDLRALLAAGALRQKLGLGISASLATATAREAGIEALATSDPALAGGEGLRVYRPSDLA
jgi:predicted nucleic acid-binding protein